MIVLDTNVVSELMRPAPSDGVRLWLASAVDETLVTTVITASEIEYGIARLPEGSRRAALRHRFEELIGTDAGLRALPLEEDAARLAGRFREQRESRGLHAQFADMLIAGIAAQIGAPIATRNTADFSDLGIKVIDPWRA